LNHDVGVPVKMRTGDALAVAREIARGVGLPNIRRVADLKAASAHAGNVVHDHHSMCGRARHEPSHDILPLDANPAADA